IATCCAPWPGEAHLRRALLRRAATSPFLRISATGTSILSLFTPARRSCSRFRNRRSLVLADQFADVLAGRAPVPGVDLALDVLLESFGKRNVQGTHSHAFII